MNQDTIPKTAEQRACKHNYNSAGREDGDGYWFKCKYCGHKIFGTFRGKPKHEVS